MWLGQFLEEKMVKAKMKDSIYKQALGFYVTEDDYPAQPLRRAVRRSESFDMQDDAEFAAFIASNEMDFLRTPDFGARLPEIPG
jgi:formate-dependent phosphoribosylglycinamide formyltransferase (GAR transformylase)